MNTSQYSYALLGLIMDKELCNSSICNNICYIKLPFSEKGLVVFKDLNRNTLIRGASIAMQQCTL